MDSEPIYIFVRGKGWVIQGPETRSLDQMKMNDICPNCDQRFGSHINWDCPGKKGVWPHV